MCDVQCPEGISNWFDIEKNETKKKLVKAVNTQQQQNDWKYVF